MQILSPRQSDIVALARSEGRVTVDNLADRFAVTPQTIRKDLNELCDSGVLNRYHGGAVPASGLVNYDYEARRQLAPNASVHTSAMFEPFVENTLGRHRREHRYRKVRQLVPPSSPQG